MCEFKSVSNCFGNLSFLLYFSVLILTFIIFFVSILTSNEFETFKYIQLIDFGYKKPINYSFLMDLNFGPNLTDSDDFGSIDKVKYLCYLGKCYIDSEEKVVYNCSLACLKNFRKCYDGETLCDELECREFNDGDATKYPCHEFNRIKFWRNITIKKYEQIFEVTRYSHIIPKDGNCSLGYKKCGIINNISDYLCLKEKYDCPINSIIVNDTNEAPDSDYKSYPFGDKYIFFSNKKINNYLITNISVIFDKYEKNIKYKIIDEDDWSNVLKYNPYTKESFKSYTYLYSYQFQTDLTYKEMIQYQEEYEKKSKIYTEEEIYKMNSEVDKYKSFLMGAGIAIFALLIVTGAIFIPYFFHYNCNFPCSFILCRNITPIKRVIIIYIVFSPCIILYILSFIFSFIKKISYNKLITKEYIEEYKNSGKDLLESSISNNNLLYVVLLIIIILIIVYPILILITSSIPSLNTIKNSEKDDYNEKQNEKKDKQINAELIQYNQTSDNSSPGQDNSINNYQAPQNNSIPYKYEYPSS